MCGGGGVESGDRLVSCVNQSVEGEGTHLIRGERVK